MTTTDTARGIVAVMGADPAPQVVLQDSSGGGASMMLAGDQGALRSLQGLDVWVEGTRTDARRFEVRRFAVRASNGIPAIDGTLERDGDRYVLVTADRTRRAVPHLPAPLREKVGARIWLAGPLDRPPDTYGIIER